jgi:hypothetical protein
MFLHAQTAIDLRTQAKNVDFSQAAATKPNKSGAALPVTCGIGETYFLTSAPPGGNLYGCTGANSWSPLGSGAGSLPSANMPGQVLAWTGLSWQATSGVGVNVGLTFPAIADGSCLEQSAALAYQWPAGSVISVTMPAQYCSASGGTCYALSGLEAIARVSSAGVATVRLCNFSGITQSLPAANYTLTPYGGSGTTVSISFPAITDGGCATQSIAVQGVTAASAIALGLPSALEPGLIVTAAPAGANSVSITACNWSGGTITPAPTSYQVNVI